MLMTDSALHPLLEALAGRLSGDDAVARAATQIRKWGESKVSDGGKPLTETAQRMIEEAVVSLAGNSRGGGWITAREGAEITEAAETRIAVVKGLNGDLRSPLALSLARQAVGVEKQIESAKMLRRKLDEAERADRVAIEALGSRAQKKPGTVRCARCNSLRLPDANCPRCNDAPTIATDEQLTAQQQVDPATGETMVMAEAGVAARGRSGAPLARPAAGTSPQGGDFNSKHPRNRGKFAKKGGGGEQPKKGQFSYRAKNGQTYSLPKLPKLPPHPFSKGQPDPAANAGSVGEIVRLRAEAARKWLEAVDKLMRDYTGVLIKSSGSDRGRVEAGEEAFHARVEAVIAAAKAVHEAAVDESIEEADGASLSMRGSKRTVPMGATKPAAPVPAGEFETMHPRGRGGKWIQKGAGLGTQGPDPAVKQLQQRLGELGFQVDQNGGYGTTTEEAVKAFQTKYGLPPTGKVDETTVAMMRNPPPLSAAQAKVGLTKQAAGAHLAAQQLQQGLQAVGYDNVKALQKDYGLPLTGKPDAATLNLIQRLQARDKKAARAGGFLSADELTTPAGGSARPARLTHAATEVPEEGTDMSDENEKVEEASYSNGAQQPYGGIVPLVAGAPTVGGKPVWTGASLLADPDDRTPGMDDFFGNEPVRMPPNLREAGEKGFQRCATCAHHNGKRLCALYSAGTDKDDLCDSYFTLSPVEQVNAANYYAGLLDQVQEGAQHASVLKVARAKVEEAVLATGGDELADEIAALDEAGLLINDARTQAVAIIANRRIRQAQNMLDESAIDESGDALADWLEEGKLSSAERDKLPDSAFAIPDKREYPIHDESHARNALARVAQHGSPSEKKRVRAAVKKRHPKVVQEALAILAEVKSSAYPDLERKPGKQNWVDYAGGLPSYIERIAKHIHYEHGHPIGQAIQFAVGTVRRWCAGGSVTKGGASKSNVSAKTKAQACAAVAEWEAKKKKGGAAQRAAGKSLKEALADGTAVLDDTTAVMLAVEEAEALDLPTVDVSLEEAARFLEEVELHEANFPGAIHFDPTLHPRGRRGEFTDVLTRMMKGSKINELTLPHGVTVRKNRLGQGVTVHQGGKKLGSFNSPEKAADRAFRAFGVPEPQKPHYGIVGTRHAVAFEDAKGMKNAEIVAHAMNASSVNHRGKNLSSVTHEGGHSTTIYSYKEPLAHIDHAERTVHVNAHKYSATSSAHRTLVEKAAAERGYTVRHIDRAESRRRAGLTPDESFEKRPAGVKAVTSPTSPSTRAAALGAVATPGMSGAERVQRSREVASRGERGRVVPGSMGSFLSPPGHPDQRFMVETDLRRRPENRGSMSLSSAVEDKSLTPETRQAAREKLREYEANKPPLEHPAVQEWVRKTLGYYKGMYAQPAIRGPQKEHEMRQAGTLAAAEDKRWNVSNLVSDQARDPMQHLDTHAGVAYVRRYYPEFKPTAEHFAPGGYGQKAETTWHHDVETIHALTDKARNSDLVRMTDSPVTIHRISGEGIYRNATHTVRLGNREKVAYSAEQAVQWAREEPLAEEGSWWTKGASRNWRTGKEFFNGNPTTHRPGDKFTYNDPAAASGEKGGGGFDAEGRPEPGTPGYREMRLAGMSTRDLQNMRQGILDRNKGKFGSQVTGGDALDNIEDEFRRRGLTINGEASGVKGGGSLPPFDREGEHAEGHADALAGRPRRLGQTAPYRAGYDKGLTASLSKSGAGRKSLRVADGEKGSVHFEPEGYAPNMGYVARDKSGKETYRGPQWQAHIHAGTGIAAADQASLESHQAMLSGEKGGGEGIDRNQLKVARDTLKMNPAMSGVMGGPSVREAFGIHERLAGKLPNKGDVHPALHGHLAAAQKEKDARAARESVRRNEEQAAELRRRGATGDRPQLHEDSAKDYDRAAATARERAARLEAEAASAWAAAGGEKSGGETRYGQGTTATFQRPGAHNYPNLPEGPELLKQIKPGTRVTIMTPQGQERSGRAVMPSSAGGWVLNMGGRHGTPGLVDERNIVRIGGRKLREIAADVTGKLPNLSADPSMAALLKAEEATMVRLPLADVLVKHGAKIDPTLREELREALEDVAPKEESERRLAEAREAGDRAKITLYETLVAAV